MADDARQTVGPPTPVRIRREELIRPADRRREFTTREAQRRLQEKERPHWALIAYAIFLAALLSILSVTYTTYAFSRFRGEVLPGVHVDQTSLSGFSETQARTRIVNQLLPIYKHPVRLTYGQHVWLPRARDIGYLPDPKATAKEAMLVGRQESFFEQLLDRLPLHPDHSVPLVYQIDDNKLTAYIRREVQPQVFLRKQDAGLRLDKDHVVLVPSHPGEVLDFKGTRDTVHTALGALSTQTRAVSISKVAPAITDDYALGRLKQVQNFLSNPPLIKAGVRVIVTQASDLAPALSFRDRVTKQRATIEMLVNPQVVQAYVATLAAQIYRPYQNPRFRFAGRNIVIVAHYRKGLSLDQVNASQKLLTAVERLKAHARLRFVVSVTKPPIDITNPASVGINTLLGIGATSFRGASSARLSDITSIASRFNEDLLPPQQDISFNRLAESGWPDHVYLEQEREVNGRLVPGDGGAMQQMATTFLRAFYATGLPVAERHAHTHRFSWYEPPVGLDAVVDPARGYDLRFHNNTRNYFFIETRVEPVRQELYVYVYGPKLGWHVAFDTSGKIVKLYQHGPDKIQLTPSMASGENRRIAWGHDGADTVVDRTVTHPDGSVRVDHLTSHYQPWQGILLTGGGSPTATPLPTSKQHKAAASPRTPAKAARGPTPTPTFSH